jgi:hypothetical protein
MATFWMSYFNYFLRFIKKNKVCHQMQRENLYNLHSTASFTVVVFVLKMTLSPVFMSSIIGKERIDSSLWIIFVNLTWHNFETRNLHAFNLNKDLTNFEYNNRFNPNFQLGNLWNTATSNVSFTSSIPHHIQYLGLY